MEDSPMYTYSAPGTYAVSLTVTTEADTADTDQTTAEIVVAPQDPIANPGGPYFEVVDTAVVFDGSGSYDPDGSVTGLQYDWDFGDGYTGIGVSPSHTYAASGTYTVTLIVVDDDSESAPSSPATTTATIDDAPCVTKLAINTAEWTEKNGKLTVRGENTKKCGPVTVSNANNPSQVLGINNGNGPKFNINVKKPSPVPCVIQVEQDGVVVTAPVANAPASCSP
jgi:PKD repeat protein